MGKLFSAGLRGLKLVGSIGRSIFWTSKGLKIMQRRNQPVEVKTRDGKLYIYLAREGVLVGRFDRETSILDGLRGTKVPIKDAIFMDMDDGFYHLKAVQEAQRELLTNLRPRVINGKVVLEVRQGGKK